MKAKTKNKKKRRAASDLVAASAYPTARRGQRWTEGLTPEETTYVCSVLAAMKRIPGAALYVVARNLKEELGLSVGSGTIARTLRELIKDDQAKA